MKRLTILLLLAVLLLVGCAVQKPTLAPVGPEQYRLQAVNRTGVPLHGFGFEWYRDGALVSCGQCNAFDGGFVENGELIAQTFPLAALGAGDYRLRVYVIDADSAEYCTDELSVTLCGGETVLFELLMQGDAYTAKISP